MVLDSVVPPDQPDPYERTSSGSFPRRERVVRRRTLPEGDVELLRDVITLANGLEAKPISGKVGVPGGGTRIAG
jgi:hypothetical protein